MAAVTTTAPLEPKTVNCSSTSMPALVVMAQPSTQRAPSAGGQAHARRPRRLRSNTAYRGPHGQAADGPLDHEVTQAGAVVDRRGTDG